MSGITEPELMNLVDLEVITGAYFNEVENGYILTVQYGKNKEERLKVARGHFRVFKNANFAITYVKEMGLSSVAFYFEA